MDLIIANMVDAYRESTARIADAQVRQRELLDNFYIQDRALLWGGDTKVVVTSLPVEQAHVSYLRQAMGYALLVNLAPQHATEALCDDILREDELRAAIVAHLRSAPEVRLIPFVARPEVYTVLERLRGEGLRITAPECPPADALSIRDYLDSKAGFRQFFTSAGAIPALRIPEGGIAGSTAEAARMAARFLGQGRACVCKPNNSQSGVGFLIAHPHQAAADSLQAQRSIQASLDVSPQMTCDCIVVEEFVDVDQGIGGGSPSIEMRIPADPSTDVEFMYLCGQILTPEGNFVGVEMHKDVVDPALQRDLEAAGTAIAREMRRLGYVGVFDMDMVVARDGQVYAVEVNTRRTGGTHAHEAAQALFGPRYWERAAVISNNVLNFEGPALDYAGLSELMAPLRLPVAGRKEGIMPTIVTSLPTNRIGYIAFAATIERARELERAFHERLTASGRPPALP